MALKDTFRFDELYNIGEELVLAEMERQFVANKILHKQTQETVLDIAAFALNLIRPMYRANLLGRVYVTAFQEEYAVEIRSAVSQAIDKVMRIS